MPVRIYNCKDCHHVFSTVVSTDSIDHGICPYCYSGNIFRRNKDNMEA